MLATGTSGSVKLPLNTGYCVSGKTIDFGTDLAHKPIYSSSEGDETYQWAITGATTYSFQAPTTASSKYPIIAFNGYGTYTVKVTFTNKCGTQSASQQIILSAPISVDAGPANVDVCFSDNTLTLNGSVNPSVAVKWTTTGTGIFNPDNNLKSVYSISNNDRINGAITLTLSAVGAGACAGSSDQINLKIFPDNVGKNSTDTICSSTKINYIPVSSVSASTFTWTSLLTKGNVSGNTANGTGNITDVLVNNDATTISEVTYTITPKANNCDGKTFTYTVRIQPNPILTANASLANCLFRF